jgi:hypothetical protein
MLLTCLYLWHKLPLQHVPLIKVPEQQQVAKPFSRVAKYFAYPLCFVLLCRRMQCSLRSS